MLNVLVHHVTSRVLMVKTYVFILFVFSGIVCIVKLYYMYHRQVSKDMEVATVASANINIQNLSFFFILGMLHYNK